METTEILGVRISRSGFKEVLEKSLKQASLGQGGYVCFTNVHNLIESHWSSQVKAALNGSFLSVADGMPLVWVSDLGETPIDSRVCGPDLMKAFLEKSADWTHGFIGGVPGQAQALADQFRIPSLCYSPPMRAFSEQNALEDWKNFLALCPGGKAPSVVWVGLGAPKQELWMHAVSRVAPGTLFFGVGAAFDFLAGNKKRAPAWMQSNGLEWLFRLSQEPKRLWRRYLVTNSVFIGLLLRESMFQREFLLPAVLMIQLFLTWFVPAIPLGERSLFLGDVWCLIWAPLLLGRLLWEDRERRKKWLPWAIGSALIALISWAHGALRPDFSEAMLLFEIVRPGVKEPFSPVRELVIALRFLSWFWAGMAVALYPWKPAQYRQIGRFLLGATAVAASFMVACKLSPELSRSLGGIYGYDPSVYPWMGRIYGIFRSPVEAGVSLALASLVLLWAPGAPRRLRQMIGGMALLGTGLAQAASSLLLAVAGFFFEWRKSKTLRTQALATLIIAIGLSGVAFWVSQSIGLKYKLVNLLSRMGPWKVYWETALSRWDYFLLGLGYNQFHADNSYVFLFNRGGVLLLLGMLWVAFQVIRSYWPRWNAAQRSAVLFILLSSLTLDTIIMRPLVALLIAACIPLLKPDALFESAKGTPA